MPVLLSAVMTSSAFGTPYAEPRLARVESASIEHLSVAAGERIIGFELELHSARVASMRNIPAGWDVRVQNNASWNAVVRASALVGAAAVDPQFFRNFLRIEKSQSLGLPFEVTGSVVVTQDFVKERRIAISTKDVSVTPVAARAQQNDPCGDKNTQLEMSSCEAQRYAAAQSEMNRVLQQLLTQYNAQQSFITKLNAAQDVWTNFRDADVDSFYYAKDKIGTYGSVYPMCRAIYLTQLTAERTRGLKIMLNRNEGDLCGFVAVTSTSSRDSKRRQCFAMTQPRPDQHVPAIR